MVMLFGMVNVFVIFVRLMYKVFDGLYLFV